MTDCINEQLEFTQFIWLYFYSNPCIRKIYCGELGKLLSGRISGSPGKEWASGLSLDDSSVENKVGLVLVTVLKNTEPIKRITLLTNIVQAQEEIWVLVLVLGKDLGSVRLFSMATDRLEKGKFVDFS